MTMGGDQTEFKNEVKQWLRSHGLDYAWMADRCGVSEITVRNWMSRKIIPPLKKQLIERAMAQLPALPAGDGSGIAMPGVAVNAMIALTIQLAPQLYQRLTERALAVGSTPENLVAQTIAELVQCSPEPLKDMKQRSVTLPSGS